MENKEKCKKLCTECTHCFKDYIKLIKCESIPVYCCKAHPKKDTTECVTGEITTHRSLCEEHNKDGQCKKYKPLSYLRLKNLLKEYLKDNPMNWACRITTERAIAEDLLRQLEGKESRLVENISTDDSPYGYKIVVTKKAIEHSLKNREYRLDAEHNGTSYGIIEPPSETEYEEKKSWLFRKRKNLRLKK